ncbi:hypothetical protein TWF281_006595 [Arthrobotrys megalospora]
MKVITIFKQKTVTPRVETVSYNLAQEAYKSKVETTPRLRHKSWKELPTSVRAAAMEHFSNNKELESYFKRSVNHWLIEHLMSSLIKNHLGRHH